MKNSKVKNVVLSSVIIVISFLIFVFLNFLLSPKYSEDLVEGSMIASYYDEEKNHDVIFIGDCEVYSNFSPMEMYRSEGITAYVRGTSQQLIWQSYYILEETLKYETPEVVVYNVNAMRYSEPVSEEYNRLTIDKMKWSEEKINIIKASMTDEEDFLSYVFPILRYHSRFDKLTGEDFEYLFTTKKNTYNGYLVNQKIVPAGTLPTKKVLPDYKFSDICYSYLDKMYELCESKGVELILIKAPSIYPYWYEEYDEQIEAYAESKNIKFYNFLDYVDEIGIDYQKDTYDGGLHMNLTGSVKLSNFFAEILKENHGIQDKRLDSEISKIYNEKLRVYDYDIENGKGK